jgi:hypothetical protein
MKRYRQQKGADPVLNVAAVKIIYFFAMEKHFFLTGDY